MTPCIVAGDMSVGLTLAEMGSGVIPFHEAMSIAEMARADSAVVDVPVWRGLPFLEVLAWLVSARLTTDGAPVEWWAPKKVLPSVGRTLRGLGWELTEDSEAWTAPPASPDPPPPRGFEHAGVHYDADWGVFSSRGLDPGTQLVALVAAEGGPYGTISDVGTGAGGLGVGLCAAGRADAAVMSDVDSVALYLAAGNATRAGVSHRLVFDDDPTSWPPTDVTVCNFPTHLPRPQADALLGRLVRRAATEPVYLVVHASLGARFQSASERLGAAVDVRVGDAHAVLRLTARGPATRGNRRG